MLLSAHDPGNTLAFSTSCKSNKADSSMQMSRPWRELHSFLHRLKCPSGTYLSVLVRTDTIILCFLKSLLYPLAQGRVFCPLWDSFAPTVFRHPPGLPVCSGASCWPSSEPGLELQNWLRYLTWNKYAT